MSADGPTFGPLGRSLTDRAIANYFADGTGSALASVYASINAPNAYFRPRLETVLDALAETYGSDVLGDVLSDLGGALPNDLHAFFHRHLHRGGGHITANFDTCIERAGIVGFDDVVHFHGALSPTAEVATLGARLGVIENGFSTEVIASLDAVLLNPDVKALVFVGYSGSDFFDATPYLAKNGGRSLRARLLSGISTHPPPSRRVPVRRATSSHSCG